MGDQVPQAGRPVARRTVRVPEPDAPRRPHRRRGHHPACGGLTMTRPSPGRPTAPDARPVLRYARLECTEGTSHKFYTVLLEEVDSPERYQCRVEWGRIGAASVFT